MRGGGRGGGGGGAFFSLRITTKRFFSFSPLRFALTLQMAMTSPIVPAKAVIASSCCEWLRLGAAFFLNMTGGGGLVTVRNARCAAE